MSKRYGIDGNRYLASHTKIRECAAIILKNLSEGKEEKPKGFSTSHVAAAYRLLKFEGLISHKVKYVLNGNGQDHVKRHGFNVYPA